MIPSNMLSKGQQDRMVEWGEQVRNAALEEAAMVAEEADSDERYLVANRIRELKRAP